LPLVLCHFEIDFRYPNLLMLKIWTSKIYLVLTTYDPCDAQKTPCPFVPLSLNQHGHTTPLDYTTHAQVVRLPKVGTTFMSCFICSRIRRMGLKWLVFLIRSLYIDWYVVWWDQRENIVKTQFKRDWITSSTTSSTINNYSTLNNGHDWEDLCIQIRNQQTCTFDNHN